MPVTSVIVWAQVGATVQFFLVAVFGALALPPAAFAGGAEVLTVIDSPKAKEYGVWAISRVMTYVFPVANILTSIPVFSIIIRYNLLQLKGLTVPVWLANVFAVVLPWVVTLPFYVGDSLDLLINWSSAIFFTLLNMLFPLAFWIAATRRTQRGLPALVADEDAAAAEEDHDLYSDRNYLLAASGLLNDVMEEVPHVQHKETVDACVGGAGRAGARARRWHGLRANTLTS